MFPRPILPDTDSTDGAPGVSVQRVRGCVYTLELIAVDSTLIIASLSQMGNSVHLTLINVFTATELKRLCPCKM